MIRHNNLVTRTINDFYNFIFKKINNIKIDKNQNREDVKEYINDFEHSTTWHNVWLLNLKRLYDMCKKEIKVENYHFLDIGCGNGIPLIYAYKKFNFKSYSGFDLVSDYVEISKKNIQSSFFLKNKMKPINVFQSNAAEFILEKDKSYFIFMFNPFDGVVMKKFLDNNYNVLKLNKSVIVYSNYIQLDIIKNYTLNISKNDKYKLAVIYF